MAQSTINERLKILTERLGLSVSAFSQAIGAPNTTTRNYIVRGSKPKSDFLTKITRRFEQVNPNWLFTGEGEMLLPLGENAEPLVNYTRNNYGNSIGVNHGTATANYTIADCEKERDNYKSQVEQLRAQLEAKDILLASKDALIAAKDETITLLRGSYNRPN